MKPNLNLSLQMKFPACQLSVRGPELLRMLNMRLSKEPDSNDSATSEGQIIKSLQETYLNIISAEDLKLHSDILY